LAAEILAAQAAWLARCATATRPAAGRRTGHGGTAVRQPAYRAAASPNGAPFSMRRVALWSAFGLVLGVAAIALIVRDGPRAPDRQRTSSPPSSSARARNGPPATRPPALAETMTKPASAGTAGEPATALDGNVAPTPIPKSTEPSPHARLAAAQRELARGHLALAKQGFQQLVDGPERAAAWVGLSRVALAQGASGEAERMARKAVG